MPEMQAPDQIMPQSPGDYLEIMSKVVFQSGMSYKIVESKWPGIREAFHGFDAAKVAGMTPPRYRSAGTGHQGHPEPPQVGIHRKQCPSVAGIGL